MNDGVPQCLALEAPEVVVSRKVRKLYRLAGSTESIAQYAYLNAMRFLDFGYSATVMLAGFVLLSLVIFTAAVLLQISGLLRPLKS